MRSKMDAGTNNELESETCHLGWLAGFLVERAAAFAPGGYCLHVHRSTDTYCSGTYASTGASCGGTYALSITIDRALTCVDCDSSPGDVALLPYVSLPYITSFTVTDGTGLSITSLTGSIKLGASTDSSGAITAFWLYAQSNSTDPYFEAGAYSAPEYNIPFLFSYDYSDTLEGQNPETGLYSSSGEGASQLPGSWTETTSPGTGTFTISAPEPSSLVLMLAGVAVVALLVTVRRLADPKSSRR